MAARTKILRGGFYNGIEFNKLEKFISEHVELEFGKKLTEKETSDLAIDCYCWVQERKKKNAPIITENDVWNWANDNGDIKHTF